MLKKSLIVWFLSVGTLAPATAQECLHGPNRTPADRGRADQAIQFARRLNAEQQLTFPTQQGRYRPLEELRTLPAVPPGFQLQFNTDRRSYSFILKDRRDPCRFAVYSDQTGDVYATTPEPPEPTVVPLGTR